MELIPQPLSESQLSELDTEKFVVIIANDNTTKFACSRNSLHRFSKLYRALSQSSSEVDELPLRCAAATPETTALVCMWMNHYDVTLGAAASSSSPVSHSPLMNQNQQNTSTKQQNSSSVTNPSRVSYPLQPGNSLSCFLNEWDSWFVEKILFSSTLNLLAAAREATTAANNTSNNNEHDGSGAAVSSSSSPNNKINNNTVGAKQQKNSIMGSCGRVYFIAITASFLQAQLLVELCSGIFAFHIREAELESRPVQAPSGESVVRSWFGLPGEFSAQERQLVLEQNKDLRDPQGILEKIKEMSEEAHDTAAALGGGNNSSTTAGSNDALGGES